MEMNIKSTVRTIIIIAIIYLLSFEYLFPNFFLQKFGESLLLIAVSLVIIVCSALFIDFIKKEYIIHKFKQETEKFGSESDINFLQNTFFDNADFEITKINLRNVSTTKDYEYNVLAKIEYKNDSVLGTELSVITVKIQEILDNDASKLLLVEMQNHLLKLKKGGDEGNEQARQ